MCRPAYIRSIVSLLASHPSFIHYLFGRYLWYLQISTHGSKRIMRDVTYLVSRLSSSVTLTIAYQAVMWLSVTGCPRHWKKESDLEPVAVSLAWLISSALPSSRCTVGPLLLMWLLSSRAQLYYHRCIRWKSGCILSTAYAYVTPPNFNLIWSPYRSCVKNYTTQHTVEL